MIKTTPAAAPVAMPATEPCRSCELLLSSSDGGAGVAVAVVGPDVDRVIVEKVDDADDVAVVIELGRDVDVPLEPVVAGRKLVVSILSSDATDAATSPGSAEYRTARAFGGSVVSDEAPVSVGLAAPGLLLGRSFSTAVGSI